MDNNNEEFKQISFFTAGTSNKKFIVINYENQSHYNLLKFKMNNNEYIYYEKNSKEIKDNVFSNSKK